MDRCANCIADLVRFSPIVLDSINEVDHPRTGAAHGHVDAAPNHVFLGIQIDELCRAPAVDSLEIGRRAGGGGSNVAAFGGERMLISVDSVGGRLSIQPSISS